MSTTKQEQPPTTPASDTVVVFGTDVGAADPLRVAELDPELVDDYLAADVPVELVTAAAGGKITEWSMVSNLPEIFEVGDDAALKRARAMSTGHALTIADAVHGHRLAHAVRLRDQRRRAATGVRVGSCPVCGAPGAVFDGLCQQDALLLRRVQRERADLALLLDGRTRRAAVEAYLDGQGGVS